MVRPSNGRWAKVKTGCVTCRIRKIKCDEQKPFCQKCVSTGRTCDEYQSPFRFFNSQITTSALVSAVKSSNGTTFAQVPSTEINSGDVELLKRCLSIKTIFNIELDCDEEAKQILEASLADPALRSAISSLRALREDFETSSACPTSATQQLAIYDYGIKQYSMALNGLVFKLSSSDSSAIKSALLCCQVFIGIEQVKKNYAAMVQHIIGGLRIMRDSNIRPKLKDVNELAPAKTDQMPLLDVLIIKLFAAPCKFAEPSQTAWTNGNISSMCPISFDAVYAANPRPRTIAPDMRTELTRIATLTVSFLDGVMQARSTRDIFRIRLEKASLLASLQKWLIDLERFPDHVGVPGIELISVCFMRVLYAILKITLLGAFETSPCLNIELQAEEDQLKSIAASLTERLKDCRLSNQAGDGTRHSIVI